MTSNDANLKGRFLETLVAFLHEIFGQEVECNARLPSIDCTGRTREIDVLVKVETEELSGCPVRIPIECRNYGERIGVEQIDAFFGKLQDVGIDPCFGIFVAASGFTSGAVRRAEAIGIRTLVAEGLTRDRLALKVEEILQSLVFWVAEWKCTSCFPFAPSSDGPDGSIAVDLPTGIPRETGSLDLIWKLWMHGDIPCTIGEHLVTVRSGTNGIAIWTVEVSAHGICLPGRMRTASLVDAQTGEPDRRYVGLDLHLGRGEVQLVRYSSAEDMAQRIAQGTARLALRTPRIIGPQMYWPPSEQTATRVATLLAANEAFTFERVEGPNLLRAWAVPFANTKRRSSL